jgi:CMP-N,N'-diacetyllegionaminic acid synthase
MKILGVIPARKGSKGIKGKNLKKLAGHPLIDYTFQLVSSLQILDQIYLTTDDDKIIKLATQYNRVDIPFIRPDDISNNDTPMHEVVSHLITYCDEVDEQYDYIALFQPTTPFRNRQEIKDMIKYGTDNNLDSLFAVTNVWHHPSEYITIKNNSLNYILDPKTSKRRQDFEKVFFITGALYIVKSSFFKNTKSFINEESEPYYLSQETMIDIDTPFHFEMAEAYARYVKNNG